MPQQRLFVEVAEDDPNAVDVWLDGEIVQTFNDSDETITFEQLHTLLDEINDRL